MGAAGKSIGRHVGVGPQLVQQQLVEGAGPGVALGEKGSEVEGSAAVITQGSRQHSRGSTATGRHRLGEEGSEVEEILDLRQKRRRAVSEKR